jgi:hypothetical protein
MRFCEPCPSGVSHEDRDCGAVSKKGGLSPPFPGPSAIDPRAQQRHGLAGDRAGRLRRAIGSVLSDLRRKQVRYGLITVTIVALIFASLWIFALRMLREANPARMLRSSTDAPERLRNTTTDTPTVTHPSKGDL